MEGEREGDRRQCGRSLAVPLWRCPSSVTRLVCVRAVAVATAARHCRLVFASTFGALSDDHQRAR